MTRALSTLDRLVVAVLGLLLVAVGATAVAWEAGWSWPLVLPDALDTGALTDLTTTTWWPWAVAAGGVVLGLLGLAWLLAHLRVHRVTTTRLAGSDSTGRLEVGMSSLASVTASRLEELAPVESVSGRARDTGVGTVVELRGRISSGAEVDEVAEGVLTCQREVAAAFPHEALRLRVLLDGPRSRKGARRRRDTVRVH